VAANLEGGSFVAPRASWAGIVLSRLLNCRALLRLRRRLFSRLPFPTLRSDVRDVIYLNWMVDAARVAHLVPAGLQVWQREGLTPLTVLTYRHGDFGLEAAGPLRRLFGSPLQSNWRLYLQEADGVPASVLFLSNIVDSTCMPRARACAAMHCPRIWRRRFATSAGKTATSPKLMVATGAPRISAAPWCTPARAACPRTSAGIPRLARGR
jgi:hypothetical protein